MMKKTLLFIFIILLILSISTVNATNETYTLSSNVTNTGDVISENTENNDTIILSNENAQKSMTDLQNTIKNNKNTTIFLTDDYQWFEQDKDLENGIIIDKSIIIDGQGHTIDANHKMRIFQVTNNAIVTFKNITFLNGSTAKTGNGGAIWNTGDKTITIINCTFNGNTASYGGAISGCIGNITNCIFTNNIAYLGGGAIYINDGGVSGNLNGTFINNTANNDGGAIYIYEGGVSGNLNGTFINNTANNDGGAIFIREGGVSGNLGGTYINNTAMMMNGGAIYVNGGGVSGNLGGTFINNRANSGGAIIIYDGVSGNLGGTFINNTSEEGGAIYICQGGVSGNLTGTYINNTAKHGGAIYIWNGGVSGNLGGTYINNTANRGGAIYIYVINEKIGVIRDCIFINNDYTIWVGSGNIIAINCWFGNNATNYNKKPTNVRNVIIDNWLFLNATANPTKLNVGETSTITFKLDAYNDTSKNISPYNSSMNIVLDLTQTLGELNKNNALIGEDILYTARETGNANVTGKFENAYYTVNIKNDASGGKKNLIINASANPIAVGENTIINVTGLEDATGNVIVTVNGKTYTALIKNGKASVNVTGLTKSVIANVNYNGDDNYNSASTNVTIIISNENAQKSMTELENTIKNNKNTTIFLNDNYQWTEQDKDLENGIIIDKSITIDGQGHKIDANNKMRIFQVTNNAIITFKNIIFLNGWTANGGCGGAVWNTGDKNITIINCTFNGNTAYYGGAISGRIGDLTNCTFTGNSASYGGAIYIDSGGVSGNLGGTFINNTASEYGGAIYIKKEGVSGNLGGTFINNRANSGGAIIIYDGVSGNLGGTFINNTASEYGGAITICDGVSGNLTGTYINNTANNDGGAIYIDSGVSGNLGGTFINNTAKRYGGAIYIWNGGVSGNLGGTFINNTSEYIGGAIYIDSGDVSGNLTGTYINNTASKYGGAIYIDSGVSGNLGGTFINNTASEYGGAIYIYVINEKMGVIHDCIFINNGNTTISTESGNVTAINCWFGNNATNYKDKPQVGDVSMSTWLFLNATANSTKIIGKTSIIFKLDSYNNTSKQITLYNASKTNLQLALSQTLGKLDKNISLIGENIIYAVGETGDASVTGKIGTAYYIISFKNNKVTLIDIINTLSTKMSYDIIKYLKMQQKYINTNIIALDVKYLQNLL